ncbi:hypothetical protein BBK82_37640 [Lentzea guizhouensis]|uniref:Uncharacterized protein n=1 Tax=Lentzea guizhouensis TaxID=1586287 RepID=A0A1B2HT21_9PSEU|nr:hypothetical protein [Lentzea guizhouensis]ANZ40861.1 hypothetical protein BBK82_37640 [Lentzea guizhouensis]
MSDYRGLGFDPVPGDAGAVAAASERCRRQVEVPEPPAGWSGAAAEAFAARSPGPRRARHGAAHAGCGRGHVGRLGGTVLANQRRAEELDRRARAAAEVEDADNAVVLASFRGGPEHVAASRGWRSSGVSSTVCWRARVTWRPTTAAPRGGSRNGCGCW